MASHESQNIEPLLSPPVMRDPPHHCIIQVIVTKLHQTQTSTRPSQTAQFASTVTNQTVKAVWENNCLLSESCETHKYNEYTECRRFTDKPSARIVREATSVTFEYMLSNLYEYHTERTELHSYRYEGNDKINCEITTLSAFKSINHLYLFSASSVQD